MPSIPRLAAVGLLSLFGSAVPADAQWRWLEHMSGPGWYDGVSLEQKLWCLYPEAPRNTGTSPALRDEGGAVEVIERTINRTELLEWKADEEKQQNRRDVIQAIEDRRAAISRPCWHRNRNADVTRARTLTIGVSGGLLWSTINRLEYDPSIPVEDTQVWVVTPGAFIDWRLFGGVEVGASLERFEFFGASTRRFGRWAFEGRSTLNLWTIANPETQTPLAHLKLRIGLLKIIDGVSPEDFGAKPGPREREWLTSGRFVIDFECLPWQTCWRGWRRPHP